MSNARTCFNGRQALPIVLACLIALAPPAASAQQIWVTPVFHYLQPSNDIWDLFQDSNPGWSSTYSHMDVFKTGIVMPRNWAKQRLIATGNPKPTDPEVEAYIDPYLLKMFDYLDARHIKVALEMGMANLPESYTGPRLEGTDKRAAFLADRFCQEIVRDHGHIDYICMDEPLWFAHYDRKGWQADIPTVAQSVAPTVAVYRKYFPNIQFIDEEPPDGYPCKIDPSTGLPQFVADQQQWLDAFKSACGVPIEGIQLDLHWSQDQRPFLPPLMPVYKRNNVKVGVFFIGGAPKATATDEEEMTSLRSHIVYWRNLQDAWGKENFPDLDMAIFQDWTGKPTDNLPETSPNAFMSSVDWYFNRSPGEPSEFGSPRESSWGPDGAEIGAGTWDGSTIYCFFKQNPELLGACIGSGGVWKRNPQPPRNMIAGPSVVAAGPGRIDLVYTDTDSSIHHLAVSGGATTVDESLGGKAIGAPAAVVSKGSLVVMARGPGNSIYANTGSAAGWTGWIDQKIATYSNPAPVARTGGAVDLFYTHRNGALCHRVMSPTGWGAEEILPATVVGAPAACSRSADTLDVFFRGVDARIYWMTYQGSWSAPKCLDVYTIGNPAALATAGGGIDLLYRGVDRALYEIRFDGHNWSAENKAGFFLGD